jgi:acyl carrier protein
MTTREEVFAQVKRLLVGQFELDPAAVTPGALLYDDLDIDSIDAVDLMVELKNFTGRKLNPETFKRIRTVDDVVSAICDLMNQPHRSSDGEAS